MLVFLAKNLVIQTLRTVYILSSIVLLKHLVNISNYRDNKNNNQLILKIMILPIPTSYYELLKKAKDTCVTVTLNQAKEVE